MSNQIKEWKLSAELGATMDVQRDPLTITITAPDGFIWIATDCDTISDQTDGDDSRLWSLIYEFMGRGLKVVPIVEALPHAKTEVETNKISNSLINSKATDVIAVAKTVCWFVIIIIVIWAIVATAPIWVTILLAVAFLLWAYG